jgi:hypothetical protein
MTEHKSEDRYAVPSLKRMARSLRLQANRASPTLATQFIELAALYEMRIEEASSTASA